MPEVIKSIRWLFASLAVLLLATGAYAQEDASDANEAADNLISDSLKPKKGKLAARLTPFADGLVRSGAWSPLHVQLANGGEAFELTLGATEMGPDYSSRSFERTVELPEGGRKDATLYLRPGSSTSIRSLSVRGDAERSGTIEYPIRMLAPTDVGIAVIGAEQLGLTSIRDTWTYGVPSSAPRPHAPIGRNVRVGLVPELAMPDRALGWSAVDWAVWPEADPTAISGEALDALLGWVASGGHLFVSVSDGYPRIQGTPLADALPVRVSGVIEIESASPLFQSLELPQPAPGPYVMAAATVKEAPDLHTEVLSEIGGNPAWVVGTYGLGTVHVLTMDPGQAPFTTGRTREKQWRRLLWLPNPSASTSEAMHDTREGYWDPSQTSIDYNLGMFWVSDLRHHGLSDRGATRLATLAAMDIVVTDPSCMKFQGAQHPKLTPHWTASGLGLDAWHTALRLELSDIPGVAPLPLSWLMAFAGLYLLVIGPLDYFVLRLMQRQPWTWITFPLTIALFSGVALVGTALTKGSQAVMTRIEVVDVLPGTPFMRGQSWFGVFSTSKTEVGVKSQMDGAMIEPLGDGGFMSEVHIGSGEASGQLSYLAQTWSLAYGQTAWVQREDPGHLEVTAMENGNYAVTSRLGVTLQHARLKVGTRSLAIGDLAPDQSVSVGTGTSGGNLDSRSRWALDVAGDFYDEAAIGHLHDAQVIGILDHEYDGLELSGVWPQRDAVTIYRIPVRIEK